jgi:hypothetical protein
MQKIINVWFEAEDIALQFSQTRMYDIGARIMKTIVLFSVCVIGLLYVLVGKVTGYAMNRLRDVETKPTPIIPKTITADSNYTENGLPEELSRKGEGMSENDYENLRKVL